MDILRLDKRNRLPRKQTGQRIETAISYFIRYYYTDESGGRKQKAVKLADKSDLYRSWSDVEPLIERVLAGINEQTEVVSGQLTLTEFVEKHYLPWAREAKAAPSVENYQRIWGRHWKASIGKIALANLTTADVTKVLTHYAKSGLGARTLSNMKWTLSGVYVYAISSGIVPKNPVPDAKWLVKVARVKKQAEYSLEQALAMLAILEPVDLRAAVAVALTYFAALRPAEARGLRWEDYSGAELTVRRTVWRDQVGETKTEGSAASVPVIEPLRSLLERLRTQTPDGYVLQSNVGNPLNLDSLNTRVITPVMKKAGIPWHGYYPGRRGLSSLLTDSSRNIQNAAGILRHSNSSTTARHYTQPQKESMKAAMKAIEEMAAKLEEPGEYSMRDSKSKPMKCCPEDQARSLFCVDHYCTHDQCPSVPHLDFALVPVNIRPAT
jgi:integrase